MLRSLGLSLALLLLLPTFVSAQDTRLVRQPSLSTTHVVFAYGSDLWIADRDGSNVRRLTSTAAVEQHPHISPDGQRIAFTSNRSGVPAVYVVSVDGGEPTRLTWYPAEALARGWTPDGQVLYASSRETAPNSYHRLWTVSPEGGPSTLLPAPWGTNASYAPSGRQVVVDRVRRWDVEWRAYRGGQNTPLVILDLDTLEETWLPNARTTDVAPVWQGDTIFFLSDRDGVMNLWSYATATGEVQQHTSYTGADLKTLTAGPGGLAFERDGYLHHFDTTTDTATRIPVTVRGDFPWAATRWENVTSEARSAALSPTGKRAVMEARGEIFTTPAEHGDARNLTKSSDAADRHPIWSPKGQHVAWFSDTGDGGYHLHLAEQDGLTPPRRIAIAPSKLGWEPTWSPDGASIAFVDDDVRVRVLDVADGTLRTVDTGGTNMERGRMGLAWSPDSKWLAYSRSATNHFRRITVWSMEEERTYEMTDPMADAFAPAWDRDGKHLYFLASTDVALGSGWANTSAMQANPDYAAYVVLLRDDLPSPFLPKSDEEPEAEDPPTDDTDESAAEDDSDDAPDADDESLRIDWEGIAQRTLALPMGTGNYGLTLSGPEGSVFIGEWGGGMTLHKFTLDKAEAEVFVRGISQPSVSADGQKMLFRSRGQWRIVGTGAPPSDGAGALSVTLRMHLDRHAEWQQMFDEAWRYERDYFYDPGLHGRDWDDVYARYAPLLPFVRHRADLTYLLDQINGELSVGHSFVFGGDYPAVDTVRVGLLGADFTSDQDHWQIERIYTTESWNPRLRAPLARPGLRVEEGHYLVAVDGEPLTAATDPYRALDGTADRQTLLHINERPTMDGAWTILVEPIRSEAGLRQRAWVEDNRRRVAELSDGKLAYVWVPNTSGAGFVSFNRYFFAQQDKAGAVIDERFNGGGLLDDYMVDLMTRDLRAAITNEVPNGVPFRLPAGILGPKVLLINELAGSGGDFFPWVFRQQNAGPLIGTRTWGGLVKSSVHYSLVDGGALTAPDNAVFDPINNTWIGENVGIAPDIEVRLSAQAHAEGRDPQLERAVQEALRLLDANPLPDVVPPPFSTPSRPPR